MKRTRTLILSGAMVAATIGIGAAPALAAQDPVLTPDQISTLETQQAAHRACLEGQGVTLPEPGADRTERPELSDEQRAALRAAREACADTRPERPELSDEQRATLRDQVAEHRACLQEQLAGAGLTRPERPAEGQARPARPELTDEQKAAVEAARTACADLAPNLGVAGGFPHGPGRGPGHGPGRGPGHGLRGPGGPGPV